MNNSLNMLLFTSSKFPDSFYCLVKEGKYYFVSFLHVVISNNTFSSFFISSAIMILLYYKDNLLVGLHYPVIIIVCNKVEIISTFHDKNLTISWPTSPVVQFFIMTQISWDITKFYMGVILSIGDHFPSSNNQSRWFPNRTNQISIIMHFGTPRFLLLPPPVFIRLNQSNPPFSLFNGGDCPPSGCWFSCFLPPPTPPSSTPSLLHCTLKYYWIS